ncbi:MAG: YIP1 family protein [Candidatus Marinimicrobia bacterium]|nr:YIP1 family protein [Candidatus Neomarinimicrobiota bacterium]
MENQVSQLSKIISVFWEPSKTFKALSEKVSVLDIIIPLLLTLIVAWVSIPYTTPIALKEQQAKMESSERFQNLPQEQKDQIMERMDKGGNPVIAYVVSPVAIIIYTLLLALIILMVSNFMLGGDRKFGELWALGLYAGLIDIVASAIKIPLMVQKGSLKVYTSLAVFMEESSDFVFNFMTKMDIFTLWKVVVIAIGISVFTRKSLTNPLIIMIVLWLIYGAVSALLMGLNPFA